MTDTRADPPDKLEAALEAFDEFLRSGGARESAGFEDLCARRSDLRDELRRLQSVFQLGRAAVTSRLFREVIREEFRDLATMTVELEEDHRSPSTSNSAAGQPGDRYTLENEIARGGMGVIWRVRDRDLSRTLAMKVMSLSRGDLSLDAEHSRLHLARFVEEAQVTAQLDHPGIVPVHEAGFDAEGRPFFTMKLVKGRDLDDVFRLARKEEDRWNLPRAVGVLVKACQALAYAHSKGVVHSDLKPANIMVGRFGEVYVMDWGLVKITGRRDLHDIRPRDAQATASLHSTRHDEGGSGDSPLVTVDGSVLGTPAYMPPEQAGGRVEEVDPSSDIYSLGAILYDLLTGQPPYMEPGTRLSPHTVLARVLDGPPRRIHLLNPEAPPELSAICEKAMAREKRDRYASSLDLAEDLQAFLDHRVVRAYRTGAAAELRSWVARNRTTAAVATGAVLLLLGIFLFGAVWEHSKAFRLREALTRQYLRRGQALSDSGDVARGLHWMARSLAEAPEGCTDLRDTIAQNLAGWGRKWTPPRTVLLQDSLASAIALSPDGKRAVTTNYNLINRFWSAETGEPLEIYLKTDGMVSETDFSPDGALLVTLDSDRNVRMWDAVSGKPLWEQKLELEALVKALPTYRPGLSFSPDSKRIATCEGDGDVKVWDARSGMSLGAPMAHEGAANSVRFSPDGRQVLTAGDDRTALLWNWERGATIAPPLSHPGRVLHAIFSPDGSRIATNCADHHVRLWSSDDGLPLGSPMLHQGVRGFAFSLDGSRLLTGGDDRAARIWNAFTSEPAGAPLLHEAPVTVVTFTAGDQEVLTGSIDGTVRLWSAETGEVLGRTIRSGEAVFKISLHPDGRTFLAGNLTHAPAIWSIEPESSLVIAPVAATTAVFARDGRRLLLGDIDGQCWWWSPENPEISISALRHDKELRCVAVSPDGKRVLTASSDKTARLWSIDGHERLVTTLSHEGEVRSAAFSRDGRLAATGSFDGKARLWSGDTGERIGTPLEHTNIVEDVAFSLDGKLLATACGDGGARLWSIETCRQVGPVMGHRGSVLAIEFSPDGKQLVTGSRDGTARFWNVATAQPAGLLEHDTWVEDVAFSPDGKRLATAAGVVRIWSVLSGELLGPPLWHPLVWEIAFSPDGTRIVGCSGAAGPPRLWHEPPPLGGDLRRAELWVEVLTWQRMDSSGVLTWIDPASRESLRAELEAMNGKAGR